MSYQEAHGRQAKGVCLAFFAVLRHNNFKVEPAAEIEIARKAFYDHAFHVDANRVFQSSIDPNKLLAFLSYRFLTHLEDSDVKKATKTCLLILCGSLKRNGRELPDQLRRYIESLLYHEVIGKPDIGIGGNGLAAIFSIICKCCPDSAEE